MPGSAEAPSAPNESFGDVIAASIMWAEARSNILKVAETYDALAQTVEDIAERQTRPWMPGEKPVGVRRPL